MQTGFPNAVSSFFNIAGGRLSFLDPPGTRYLSGSQRMLGMFTGHRISQDNLFDKIHRGSYQHANQRLGNTIRKGWQDGILTRAESNQIKNASRHRGISRQRVSIWIYEGELSIEYRQTLLARYRCDFDPQRRQLQDVNEPRFYDTPFASPQLELIELDDEQWIKFQRRPTRHYSRRMAILPQQLSLIDVGASALVLLALKAI